MKLFSPEKANALIPVLEPIVQELWLKRRALAIKLLECDSAMRGGWTDRAHDRRMTRWLPEFKAEIVRLVNRIEAYGCVVKSIDLGLLDFPALRQGRPIYLCWKAGEATLTCWHATDEGYSQRRPLDEREC